MAYHFCFWREGPDKGPDSQVTSLPLGISYADAKAIVNEQAGANSRDQETFWYLGSIFIDQESPEKIKHARTLWRLHVPAKAPAFTNERD